MMKNGEHKNCHFCSGKVNSGLIKCIYCGSLLNNDFEQDSSLLVNRTISWLGGNYYGEVLVDKPHGYGVFTSPEGVKYSGEWRDGKPHGKGKLSDKDGGVYEGAFKHGKRHGLGVYNYRDGSIYDGEWKEGKYHLKGSLTNREGDTFTGSFKDGKKNGDGVILKKDGTIAVTSGINYCRKCGEEPYISNTICPYCGFETVNGHDYCQKCGSQTLEGQIQCKECGIRLLSIKEKGDETIGFISFFLPIVGFIIYAVLSDSNPGKAKSALNGALIGLVVSFFIFVWYMSTI